MKASSMIANCPARSSLAIDNDTAATNPGVARSFVWSFVTPVRVDSTERLLSSLENSKKGEVGIPWKKISHKFKIW